MLIMTSWLEEHPSWARMEITKNLLILGHECLHGSQAVLALVLFFFSGHLYIGPLGWCRGCDGFPGLVHQIKAAFSAVPC